MLMGTRKAVAALILLALAAIGAAGCGSEDEQPAPKPPPVSAATANHLATLSERIATDLDAGETCEAAYAADELEGAVEEADLSATLRPEVQEVASRLVDEVNCPPPPPAPEPKKPKEEKPKEEKKPKQDEEGGGAEGEFGGPGHSGGLPPGQAKIKGEAG
jgi:hypothetical protein